MTVEVLCPACGALIDAGDRETLVIRAREHTIDAHGYNIPSEHVLDSCYETEDEGKDSE